MSQPADDPHPSGALVIIVGAAVAWVAFLLLLAWAKASSEKSRNSHLTCGEPSGTVHRVTMQEGSTSKQGREDI
jgi:hypothetical protein